MLEEDQLLFLDVALRSFLIYHRYWRGLEWLGIVQGKGGDEVECMVNAVHAFHCLGHVCRTMIVGDGHNESTGHLCKRI